MAIKKYSKPSKDILEIKKFFFDNDQELWKENMYLANIYRAQPRRIKCKNCDTVLSESTYLFTKQKIEYYLCNNCMHFNGGYEDTQEFVDYIYMDEQIDYPKMYKETERISWEDRVKSIYQPKATFLFNCLNQYEDNCKNLNYIDMGAGSGYFVQAIANICGYDRVVGYEPNSNQVSLANAMIGQDKVKAIKMSDLNNILDSCNSEVISFIGVLEHLIEPRVVLKKIAQNRRIKYLFISLPLFSFNVFFELANEEFFNRHLSGGHTHLYTKESINYFCKEFDFDILDEWYFGTDMVDLFRFYYVKMQKLKASGLAIDCFKKQFAPIIDELQATLDKTEFCSEVHLLIKTN